MNACEWTLLLGEQLAITIHLIDRGIDTGPVIARIPIEFHEGDKIEQIRDRCVFAGVGGLRAAVDRVNTATNTPHANAHRQCYVMAPAIKELLEHRLANRGMASRSPQTRPQQLSVSSRRPEPTS